MYYYDLTGEITEGKIQELIHFFNSKIIDENYSDTFTIFISSEGGDIDSAIRVFDFLKIIKNKVFTVGFGQIDSAAIIIFLSGDRRVVIPKTRFRFHEATYNVHQEKSSLVVFEEKVSLFKELDNRMKEIVVSETGINKKKVFEMYNKGVILNSQKAKDLGVVHEIVQELPKPINIT